MTTEWSLDELYKGFDDPAYGKDVAELTAQIDALATLLADAGRMQEKERTEKVLAAQSGIAQLFYQLSLYVELRQSVNTEDGTVMAENAKLMKLQAKIAPLEAAAQLLQCLEFDYRNPYASIFLHNSIFFQDSLFHLISKY